MTQLVEDNWAKLDSAVSVEVVKAFRGIGQLPGFEEFDDEEILKAVEEKRNKENIEGVQDFEDLKLPEWNIFSGRTNAPATADFRLRPIDPPVGYEKQFVKTVLVERIREVRALLNFTRVESPGDFMEGEEVPQERRAPLSRNSPTWVPASEVRGEGIFLEFNADELASWVASKAVQSRETEFYSSHKRWREMRNIEPFGGGFPRMAYIMIHSFAHALMRELTLECGYTSASVRERIYCGGEQSDAMAGFLIYTAAPDSEGTLGGLVALGQPDVLGHHIDQALEQTRLCASDPLCAEHSPASALTIHGAACHACLFVPETSCERGNRYLDRATLVHTYAGGDFSFFEKG